MASDEATVNIPVLEGNYLSGKNIVITGGTSGIGLSMAETFLRNSCESILITGRDNNRLKATVSGLTKKFPHKTESIYYATMDLSDMNALPAQFNNICNRFGEKEINAWVNNAGIYQGCRFGTVTEEIYDKLMDVNLKAQFFLSQAISDYMITRHIEGNILNICSSSSYRPSIDPYMLSKLGMSGLTLGMAKKLIKHGIVVNGIAPGPTFTPMLHKEPGDALTHGGVPAGRYIMPQEIANIATFLISDMGRMIVGDVVKMTGGSAVTTFDDVTY